MMSARGRTSGGTVTLTQGSVAVTGNGGGETGLLAQSAGSTITATDVAVTVSGGGGDVGARALDGGAIRLSGGSVAATGSGGGEIGLQASGAGSTITATEVTVSVPSSSGGGAGVQADSAGQIALTNTTVNTAGASTTGLLATGTNSSISAIGVDVTTSGSTAHAAAVTGGGTLNATGNLTANGAGSNALNVNGGDATVTVTILTSPNGASIAAQGGTSNVNLVGALAVANNGQWLNVSGGSTLTLAATNGSTVQGVALTDAGSTSDVTLRTGSLWTMTGNSNVTNLTHASSVIQFTPPVGDPTLLPSYKTLTAVNYVGRSGTLGLNTYLGADGSPSDRLVINGGTATGNSMLNIANTTGAGALTTGNGILVVDAINGGTTAAGAFGLAGPVVAGPYDYTLFRSSVDASNPQAWYLRSTLDCVNNPTVPACDDGGGVVVVAVTVAEVVAVVAISPASGRRRRSMRQFHRWRCCMGAICSTLCMNAGAKGRTSASMPIPRMPRVGWGRVIGVNGVQQGDSLGVLRGSAGPHFSYSFLALQAGMDIYRYEHPDGSRDHAGAYFAIGGDQGRVTHFTRRQGDSNFAAYSLGGYWTHFGPSGWYIELDPAGHVLRHRQFRQPRLACIKHSWSRSSCVN